MKTATQLNITSEEVEMMNKLVGSGKLKSKFAVRLLVILNRESGKTLESIAEFLGISFASVIRYIKQYNSEGMESLLKNKTRKPGTAPISVEKKNEIWAHRKRCANSVYRET